MNKWLSIMLLVLVCIPSSAQDLTQYKRVIKKLSSAKYQGRGYAKDGANKAGKFLQREFEKAGVDEVTLQPFKLDINTFCGKMQMWADGKKLQPGVDFSMREYSPGVHGEFPVYHVDTLNYDAERMFADLAKPEYANALVCCDFWFSYKHKKEFSRLQRGGECNNAGLLQTWASPIKFFKAYGEKVVDKPIIWVTPEAIEGVQRVKGNVDNKFLKDYKCFNVIAKVAGERHDSCYVFTAHYDHLGNLGKKVFYAGANDNASGTAAIVTLAAYYAKHRPPYDMYFIAFSGEDANLRGSNYYVDHPIVPLSQIKYLFNIDMIGDNNPVQYCEVSDEGMRGYKFFEKINAEKHHFKDLHRGDLAANSDHYPFATRHVPCIFLENEKGDAFQYYHTIFDTYKTVRFDSYEPVFRLVRDFIEQYTEAERLQDKNAASLYEQTTYIPQEPDYNDASMWVTADGDNDDTGADIFYIVSTWEEDWTTEDGRICHYADVWNPEHRGRMADLEINKVATYMSPGNRFFAPFYRHTTIEAWMTQNEDTIRNRTRLAMGDVCAAFDYFQAHRDTSRPLIIAGFSQGGLAVVELLKHIDDETYSQLAAAYVLGYKVTKADMAQCSHIRPAEGETDTGVTICYNTVKDVKYVIPVISASDICINPVNWRTDATPATLHDTITVTVAPSHHILVVSGYSGSEYAPYKGFLNVGDIHSCEPWLYSECLAKNIKVRAKEWRKINKQ